MKADVSSKAEVDAMGDAVIAKWGTVDILVNNAASTSTQTGTSWTATEAWWDQVQAVNLKGAFLCFRTELRTSWRAREAA